MKFVSLVEVSLAVVWLKVKQTQSQLFVLFGYDGLLADVLQDNARFDLLIEALVRQQISFGFGGARKHQPLAELAVLSPDLFLLL